MKKLKLTLFISISLLLLTCKKGNSIETMVEIESTLIAQGCLYGAGEEGIEKQNLVISNQEDWEGLVKKMDKVNTESEGFTEKEFDFNMYQVIAVFDEVQSSGGYSVDLDIESNTENIVVKVTCNTPEGFATTVLTQPYHIVRIPVSDLTVIFE